jgi:hypothetical protein
MGCSGSLCLYGCFGLVDFLFGGRGMGVELSACFEREEVVVWRWALLLVLWFVRE